MAIELLALPVEVALTTVCTYGAARLRQMPAALGPLSLILLVATLVALLPSLGLVAALALSTWALMRCTGAPLVEALWVAATAKGVALALLIGAGIAFAGGPFSLWLAGAYW